MKADNENDIARVAAELRIAGLPEVDALASLAVRSCRIIPARAAMDVIRNGQSRFGGVPDVPVDFIWPSWRGRPLAFLAQIDLAELAVVSELPSSGWLLFFYDAERQPWGFDPKHSGCARVVYVCAPREALVRCAEQVDHGCFSACTLKMASGIDLPDPLDSVVARAGMQIAPEHRQAYLTAMNSLAGTSESRFDVFGTYHHLLGNPQLAQGDMRRECQFASSGVRFDSAAMHELGEGEGLADSALAEWQLLLQLDTDEAGPGWVWGDTGRLYFWIRREDLIARAFEKAWLILQSC